MPGGSRVCAHRFSGGSAVFVDQVAFYGDVCVHMCVCVCVVIVGFV